MGLSFHRWPLLEMWAAWGLVGASCLAPERVVALEPAYDNYAALVERLEKIAAAPTATLSSLGETGGQRKVWLLTLAEDPKTAADKPALLLVGSVEASDLAAGEVMLQIAEQLVGANDEPTRQRAAKLLERFTLYVIPRPSPDASERAFAELQAESNLNLRPTDDDRDGEVDEDPADDMNADGLITMMRVESPAGTWMTHPEDPRVMIEADPKRNERGRYLLFTEGRDNDGDGKWNEDRPGGVDFNRNFTFKYPYFEPGAGPHQVSEPETRGVADFAFDHPNIAYVYSFGPHDNIHHPWKPNGNSEGSKYKTAILSADAAFQDKLAETIRQSLDLKDPPPAAGDEGAFAPWAYFHYGRWSLATRAWWVPTVSREELAKARAERVAGEPASEKVQDSKPDEAQAKAGHESRGAEQLNALRWLELMNIDGFVPWQPIEHPDFPRQKVEVGGFHPRVLLNPPPDLLAGLAEKHLRALEKMLELAPRLSLAPVQCDSLGGGVYRVKASVRNDGFLPTIAAQGWASKLVAGVQAELKMPEGFKLLTGSPRRHLKTIAGHVGAQEVSWILLAEPATDAARGGQKLTLRAWSPVVGETRQEVVVPPAK